MHDKCYTLIENDALGTLALEMMVSKGFVRDYLCQRAKGDDRDEAALLLAKLVQTEHKGVLGTLADQDVSLLLADTASGKINRVLFQARKVFQKESVVSRKHPILAFELSLVKVWRLFAASLTHHSRPRLSCTLPHCRRKTKVKKRRKTILPVQRLPPNRQSAARLLGDRPRRTKRLSKQVAVFKRRLPFPKRLVGKRRTRLLQS